MKNRLNRISKGQTAVFAYPSDFSAAKVHLLPDNQKIWSKVLTTGGTTSTISQAI
jgi:hypothetical protein